MDESVSAGLMPYFGGIKLPLASRPWVGCSPPSIRYSGRHNQSGAIFAFTRIKNAPLILIRSDYRPKSRRTAIMGETPMLLFGPPIPSQPSMPVTCREKMLYIIFLPFTVVLPWVANKCSQQM